VKNPPIDGAKVIDFIRKKGRAAKLAGPEKLRVEAKMPAWQERAQAVKDILQQLAA
jgi:transcription-repair coupling factor (superfamily II helicase)